jgi:hypothetical protein
MSDVQIRVSKRTERSLHLKAKKWRWPVGSCHPQNNVGSFNSTSKQLQCDIDACSTYRPLLAASHYLHQIIWSHAMGCLASACSCGVGGIKIAPWGSRFLYIVMQ